MIFPRRGINAEEEVIRFRQIFQKMGQGVLQRIAAQVKGTAKFSPPPEHDTEGENVVSGKQPGVIQNKIGEAPVIFSSRYFARFEKGAFRKEKPGIFYFPMKGPLYPGEVPDDLFGYFLLKDQEMRILDDPKLFVCRHHGHITSVSAQTPR